MVNKEFFSNAIIPAELFNILNTSFGFSYLLPYGIRGNMSLSLGFGVSVCVILALLYYLFDNGKKKVLSDDRFTKTSFAAGCVFLFAATTVFPWQLLQQNPLINKFAGLVRMPWRFLSIATPLIVITATEIAEKYIPETKKRTVLFVTCTVCAIFMVHFGTVFTTGVNTSLIKGQAPDTHAAIGYDKEYLIKGTDVNKLTANKYRANAAELRSYEKSGTNIILDVKKSQPVSYVEVPLLYYPGYSAKAEDGTKLETVCGDNNVLRVNLNGASGEIKIKYGGFWYFNLAEIISFVTFGLLVLFKPLKKYAIKKTSGRQE